MLPCAKLIHKNVKFLCSTMDEWRLLDIPLDAAASVTSCLQLKAAPCAVSVSAIWRWSQPHLLLQLIWHGYARSTAVPDVSVSNCWQLQHMSAIAQLRASISINMSISTCSDSLTPSALLSISLHMRLQNLCVLHGPCLPLFQLKACNSSIKLVL